MMAFGRHFHHSTSWLFSGNTGLPQVREKVCFQGQGINCQGIWKYIREILHSEICQAKLSFVRKTALLWFTQVWNDVTVTLSQLLWLCSQISSNSVTKICEMWSTGRLWKEGRGRRFVIFVRKIYNFIREMSWKCQGILKLVSCGNHVTHQGLYIH